ncbi:MAG: hypothetical protein NTW87_30730 [Planctomycetota bacterium]|nr:hypothetical protein [Planctomycetota bacterium]
MPSCDAPGFDSRLFTLDAGALPPGDYRLWLEAAGAKSLPVPLTIVPAQISRSPFFVHTMSGCTGRWPTSDEGLDILRKSGLEMATASGFNSGLDLAMPAFGKDAPAGAPIEVSLRPAANDIFLERMLRHRIRLIEMATVRAAAFYNESLSYHHSYKPSVDRTVRRMQIFTQQTGDYPAWYGINYSWFPAWWGYTEGGVPTDAHTKDRNEALAVAVKQAGFADATKEERDWYEKNKLTVGAAPSGRPEEATRDKALAIMRKAVNFWNAREDLAWGRHNKLYNDAVREVRPDTTFALFDNAGHDLGKRTRALFNDMAAACYESYTDFGEWPMSAAFTTDWARSQNPGKRVWLTTDWGTSSEGQVKSLFHAFGRGLAGGGAPLQEEAGLKEIARRGTGMAFLGMYGAIAARASPDHCVAILTTAAHQVLRGGHREYDYHALYYHLTRLGYPPVLVADEDVAQSGIPAGTQVLFLCREEDPLEPKVLEALQTFQKNGGHLLATSDCLVQVEGAATIPIKIKSMWDMSGFTGKIHGEMWEEFEKNIRQPLSAALAKTGIAPLAVADWERGLAVALTAGPVRYVVVIADKKGAASGVFEPIAALPVSLGGTGWTVRDLVKQTTLKTEEKDGRTTVAVDLVTEPTTILALYKAPPETLTVSMARGTKLGGDLLFSCAAKDKSGTSLRPIPVRLTITDPAGRERETIYRAGGDQARFPIAAHDTPGTWKVTAQELLTGLAATAQCTVEPAEPGPAVVPIAAVHVVNEAHLRAFAQRPAEKWIIVEPGQEKLLPVAQKLTDALNAGGMKARLWQVKPEEYDTIPLRWYPRPYDTARMKLIEEGKLIGYRGNLKPYIDTKLRAHVPEKGGWSDIDPPYMVGSDCIVFSGGRLAESLRAVTPWMDTPNVPGRGQGRLVAVFSPFLADKMAVAVIGNDAAGLAKAAERLPEYLAKKAPDTVTLHVADMKDVAAVVEPKPVVHPFHDFTPVRRVERLLATRSGKAAVFLKGNNDTLAFVDENGKIASTVAPECTEKNAGAIRKYDLLDDAGNVWHYIRKANSFNEAWHFATSHTVIAQCIAPDGKIGKEAVLYDGDTSEIAPEWWFEGSFPVAPNGTTAFLGRKAGLLLGRLGEAAWTPCDDLPFVRDNFEVRTPRFPVAVTFSPDSTRVFFTMDTRPQPFGGMNGRAIRPMGNESVLVDVATGKRLWSLRGKDSLASTYAAHPGFVALSRDGAFTALTDWNGIAYLVDKAGKVLAQAESVPPADSRGRNGPTAGVGTWISDDGSLAAYGFSNLLLLASEPRASASGSAKIIRVPVAAMVSGCVAEDGTLAVAALESGDVTAFAPDGAAKWTFAAKNVGPFVASVGANQTLVATSAGELVFLDKDGKEIRRTNVAAAADKEKHVPAVPPDLKRLPPPPDYRDCGTLALAQKHLGAKQIAAWQPQGEGQAAFGQTLYPLSAPVTLSAGDEKECFLRLVYRRPSDSKALTISTSGGDGKETFELDLPTPEYRAVCIPIRGPKASATVTPAGALQVAEFSLWSIRWPGPNLAFVKQPGQSGVDVDLLADTGKKDDGKGDLALELEDGKVSVGAMKDCRIWWPNPDIDKVAGQWLKPRVSGLAMVDGKRFGNGKVAPWAAEPPMFTNFMGAWFTLDFGKPVRFSLAATYERAARQSEVSRNIALLSNFDAENSRVIAGAVGNDQFWCLFALPQPVDLKLLGVLSFNGGQTGLSEVEVYK